MLVVSAQVAVVRRGGAELHVGAEVVPARLAVLAETAGHARFNGNPISWFKMIHLGTASARHSLETFFCSFDFTFLDVIE